MTRLRRGESLQADGIRDMMESHAANGSSSSTAMNSTKIWERQPYRGGSVHSASKATTSTHSFNDHYGVIKVKALTTSFTTGSTKGVITNTMVGWGTSGGVQGASSGGTTTAIGTVYDGTSTIGNSAIPFSYLAPNADGNKWVSYLGYISTSGLAGTFTAKIAFEGGGAQTGDTDWTKVHFAQDIENAYNTAYNSVLSSVSVTTMLRTDATVTSESSRIVYSWAGVIPLLPYRTDQTADFISWVKFE